MATNYSNILIGCLLIVGLIFIPTTRSQRCFQYRRPLSEPAECESQSRYRTISGRCNNLANPTWGSKGVTLRRFLANAYSDRRDSPRGGRHPSSLPNPRWISQKNHPDNDVPDSRFTHMVMQFGQFLDHDITLTPKNEETDCCHSGVQAPECFTISIPSPDRFFSWVNNTAKCLNFLRSIPVCNLRTREQYNDITAFIDASNVYGSTPHEASVLRTYRNGELHRNSRTNQLPTREQLNLRPNLRLLRPEKPEDFMAGDNRVNEHPFLATLHVLFMREHNKIAKLLKEYLPSNYQTDEIIYQEARRLVGAEMQNIVYGEYLPTVLGVDYMRKFDLIVSESSEYDTNVDPSIFNSFATSAFRFGHSMINGMFKLVSQRRNADVRKKDVYWLWRLREVFDGQSIRGARLPLENMVEGLVTQEAQTCDSFFSTEITDHLFQKNHRRENFGEDLLSLNIQRGRDHGLPSYNSFRRSCGLREINNWSTRPTEISKDIWNKFQDVYESVNDIDLYVGGISEVSVQGGVVGPTFACLIGNQFSRLKKGDRYFYTHSGVNGGRGLGPVARSEVLKRTLGDIICGVTQLENVQKWVTLQTNTNFNQKESCLEKTVLDIRAIAREIVSELSASNSKTSLVTSSGLNNRNSLLQASPRIQINQQSQLVNKPIRPNNNRVREDFSFPREVRSRARALNSNSSRRLNGPTTNTRNGNLTSEQVLVDRLSGKPRFGVSSHACLFKLCPLSS